MSDCFPVAKSDGLGESPRAYLISRKSTSHPDWAKTISNLMSLAQKANQAFEFDLAIKYLNDLEEIWNSKQLEHFEIEQRLELYRQKGQALACLGKHEEAIAAYEKILHHCRDNSLLSTRAETFTQIGQLLSKQGEYDRALGYLQRAIGAFRRLNDRAGLCRVLRNLGVVFVELGEFEEAEINYRDAIQIAEQTAERMLYADLVNNLGTIMNMKGDAQKALELYHKSLEIYELSNEIRKSAYTKNNIAITLSERGSHDKALTYFQEAYQIATEIGDAALKLIVNINLADINIKRGEVKKARRHCAEAKHHLEETNTTNGHLVETHKIAGIIAVHENDFLAALESFETALELSRQCGTRFLEAEVLLERGSLLKTMDQPFDALTDLESSYHIYTALKAEGKKEVTEDMIDSIEELYLDIFRSLATDVDFKDAYTKGHSDRVASLALLLGKEIGLDTHMLKTLVAGALLHDIGKIKIDDAILKKEGRLTDAEFSVIKKHSAFGVEMLCGKEFPWDIKPLIMHHHERIDGTGYPLGLKGEDIPLSARIVCVVDVFDALTSDRTYRRAFDSERAIAIMKDESGTTFDPVLLKCFIILVERGEADLVINSRTSCNEMNSIWSRCMPRKTTPADSDVETIVAQI